MISPSPSTADSGLDRRTLLKTGAWAVPTLAVAVAAPAASASTPQTVNLTLEGPQAGSSYPLFTPSLTERYLADAPYGTVIVNTGSTEYVGPLIVSLEVDRRLWNVTGFTYDTRGSAGRQPLPFSGPTISGNRATYTVSFAATVAAGSDAFNGVLVLVQAEALGEYPNDRFEPADSAYTWAILEPNDDANPADNVREITAGAPVSAAPFGGEMTAQFEEVASGTGSAYRPTSATLTSIGPNSIAAGDGIRVGFDATLGDSVDPQNVTLNGTAAAGLLTLTDNSVSGGRRSVLFALTAPLAQDDVVAFDLEYGAGTGGTPLSNTSQIGYVPATANSDDQRGGNVSYVNQPGG